MIESSGNRFPVSVLSGCRTLESVSRLISTCSFSFLGQKDLPGEHFIARDILVWKSSLFILMKSAVVFSNLITCGFVKRKSSVSIEDFMYGDFCSQPDPSIAMNWFLLESVMSTNSK